LFCDVLNFDATNLIAHYVQNSRSFVDFSLFVSIFAGQLPISILISPPFMEISATEQVQQTLFRLIMTQMGEKKALPVLCEILSLNKSAVYSRINGSKTLALEELLLLMQHFQINSELIFAPQNQEGQFKMQAITRRVRSGREFMSGIDAHFQQLRKVPDLQLWFSTDELPFFYCLQFRELALFKLFTYARINWQLPYTEKIRFDPDTFPERELYDELMRPIGQGYAAIPSIEFWTDDIYYNIVKQIHHFTATGQIASPTVAQVLIEQLNALCEHQYNMAKEGVKWLANQKGPLNNAFCAKFELYHNIMAPSNITILAESSQHCGVYSIFDDPNFLYSNDPSFVGYTQQWMQNIRRNSVKISEESEHLRRIYFNRLSSAISAPA
jgi:hypothetical protein